MKSFRSILVLLSALPLVFVVGCQGAARQVESCDECHENASSDYNEYCVEGEPNQLYCANPCLSNASCKAAFWCVPLWDEGTPWTTDGVDTRWVCMPDYYYSSYNRVWYWGETSCLTGDGDECPGGMQCLLDDTGMTDIFFCSDQCSTDSSCIGGCCYDTGDGLYCAPYDPYCI
ncbi:MAG TPA: hypothetical protein VM425_22460 [Myxococcota bacterium]|nr:hypothetical protein [Myxococcota bacterium]